MSHIQQFFSSGFFSVRKILGGIFIIGIVGILLMWGILLRDLPDITMIEKWGYFNESTVIYDKNGNELYSYSDSGKRTYVPYEAISQSIKDALISTEDRWFFENPWVDIFGLTRAGISYLLGKTDRISGTSTLSQQLVKNTLLTNERSLKRKIQEAYLAYELNKNYSKEKILEMYLNAIEFWHNAKGIEEASKTFFGKSAKDVWPLGASILASLPKSPTRYSPYNHRDLLMGKIEAYPTARPTDRVTPSLDEMYNTYAPLYTEMRAFIKNITYTPKWSGVEVCNLKKDFLSNESFFPDSKGCKAIQYTDIINLLGSIKTSWILTVQDKDGEKATENYTLEYTVWRKDIVASGMFENKKIDGKTFGQIVYDGMEFQFSKNTAQIKYPYFVMYVQEYLESKYDNDLNIKNGLKIYTTIDPKLQDYAEQVIKEQVASNKKTQWATSAALISMDNITGKLLAMVGWPDYFDEENGGNNNMTLALRQPGSSFKPLIYGLAISKNPIWPMSPVADVDTSFWTYQPNNYDGKYTGIMTVAKALAYSRNIPAVKMYFLAGKEKEIIPFVESLGIKSLSGDYWASLSLGAGEVRPIDLMQAYSVFANNGSKKDLYFIERIEDSDGKIIEEHKDTPAKEIFSSAAAYIINMILSDNENRPNNAFWREQLSIPGKTVAAKTGTANKPAKNENAKILPGDTWTVWWSPNITTVVWAGNVDGSALKGTCDGINCAAPAWKKFMTLALSDLPKTDFPVPKDLITQDTTKSTGLLPGSDTSKSALVKNFLAVPLKEVDGGSREVKIDSLCGWIVTSDTPEESIVSAYVPTSKPIIDWYDPDWTRWFFAAANNSLWTGSGWDASKPCERPKNAGNISIQSEIVGVGNNILSVSWSGDRSIVKFRVTADGKVLKEESYNEWGLQEGNSRISTNQIKDISSIQIDLIDNFGFRYTQIGTSWSSENPQPDPITENPTNTPDPTINLINPSRGQITLYSGDPFNLRFSVIIWTQQRNITISLDGNILQSATNGDTFIIPISSENLSEGDHAITITAEDAYKKTDTKNITLTVLPR